ncbi:MAG TPA: radical SAM protein [Gemmatimonadaceae bacterium]|jgi:anaerobic magnesium-protoporphyrin IX monomethyl ester cyclase
MILLANSFFLGHDPKQLQRMKPYPPLATLLVAAALRARGHEVALFDATFAAGVDDFVAMLDELQPDVVGILEDNFNYLTKMCTVATRDATRSMVAAARARGCRVAVNGSDSSDSPRPYLDSGADAVLLGEADVSFLELADAWRQSRDTPLAAVPGLVFIGAGGNLSYTTPGANVDNLDAAPLPAWDLVDDSAYRGAWRRAHGRFSWNMVASRGCPFGCNWCAKPIFGRRYLQRSPDAVAREMRKLKDEIAPDHIWFADDIFGLTPRWIRQFADAVVQHDARIPFMIQCRADLLRPTVAASLARAGAEEVWLGVESGSQKILDAMDKGTTIEEIREATRALRAEGIRTGWFLQLGYPGETWQDVLLTRDLVRDAQPDDIGVSVSYPLPGTKFHERVRQELGLRHNWEHTDDLAMLFHGTFTTPFYRELRDALHDEVRTGVADDARWLALEMEGAVQRSPAPLVAVDG